MSKAPRAAYGDLAGRRFACAGAACRRVGLAGQLAHTHVGWSCPCRPESTPLIVPSEAVMRWYSPQDRLRDAPILEPVQHLARLLPAVPAMVAVRPAVPSVAPAGVPVVMAAVVVPVRPCQCLRNAEDLGGLRVRGRDNVGRGGVGRAGEEQAGPGESSRRGREGHGTSNSHCNGSLQDRLGAPIYGSPFPPCHFVNTSTTWSLT